MVVAKHALRGLTLAQAVEYGPRGVRVFSASPGFMQTALTEQWDGRLREAIQAAARNSDPGIYRLQSMAPDPDAGAAESVVSRCRLLGLGTARAAAEN